MPATHWTLVAIIHAAIINAASDMRWCLLWVHCYIFMNKGIWLGAILSVQSDVLGAAVCLVV
jgi:hypothetical protein